MGVKRSGSDSTDFSHQPFLSCFIGAPLYKLIYTWADGWSAQIRCRCICQGRTSGGETIYADPDPMRTWFETASQTIKLRVRPWLSVFGWWLIRIRGRGVIWAQWSGSERRWLRTKPQGVSLLGRGLLKDGGRFTVSFQWRSNPL